MRICQQQLQMGCRTEESLGDFRASVQKIKIKFLTKPCLNTATQEAVKGQGLFSLLQPTRRCNHHLVTLRGAGVSWGMGQIVQCHL